MCNSNDDFAENPMMIKGFDDDPDDEKGPGHRERISGKVNQVVCS